MNSLFSCLVLTLKRYLPSRVYYFARNGYHWCRKIVRMLIPRRVQSIWYSRSYWVALCLRQFFSEQWLAEKAWNYNKKKRESLFFTHLIKDFPHLRRLLTEEESIKLSNYTHKYQKIKVYIWMNNMAFAGACSDYVRYINDWRNSDEDTCAVFYFEGFLEGTFVTWNQYLSDKLQQEFETITRESYSFWCAFLENNQERVVLIDTWLSMKWMYKEAYSYFKTGEKIKYGVTFAFSKDEERRGQKQIKELGIETPYICIFARDPRFNKELRIGGNAGYSIRDSDIDAFKLTTQYFWKQHIQTVRMGALVQSEYCCDGAIDYANHGRTEFLDIFIFSRCNFFISGGSGITCIAHFLNIPLAVINLPCVLINSLDRVMPMEIGIYVKYYDPQKKRFLRLREIADMEIMVWKYLSRSRPLEGTDAYDEYVAQHYEVIHNSPEEILDLAKEMEAIQNKTIQYTEHDEELQRRYRKIIFDYFSVFPVHSCVFLGRVGMKWLRDNEWFLE